MDAFFNGPLGQIAGIALEKLRNNSPRSSEAEKIRSQYDALEAHIQGVTRVLKPAVNLLFASKSADRTKSESQCSTSSVNYYTPQKQSNCCPCRDRNNQKNSPREKQFPNEKFSEISSKIPWKTCDACQLVSKFLIPTSCDHEICQKCAKVGKDCQKCLTSVKNIKREKM